VRTIHKTTQTDLAYMCNNKDNKYFYLKQNAFSFSHKIILLNNNSSFLVKKIIKYKKINK